MLAYDEIVVRARMATDGLSPLERAALGVTIIEAIRQANQFALVNQASRICADHGQALCKASMDGLSYLPDPKYPTDAITHEEQSRDAEPPRHSRARAVLAKLREIDEFVDNSIIGDLIGVAALATILIVGLFWGYLQ
ncbi:hypothetical protein [Thalassovita sp.]|uniref:hypothetical protein n=1 Tax=Thalassovita sp. TaxID=1979401 RepID=UPI002B270B51|nr:hypothetical protein [Thalassovita sp.]